MRAERAEYPALTLALVRYVRRGEAPHYAGIFPSNDPLMFCQSGFGNPWVPRPATRASLRQLWISPDTAGACLSPEISPNDKAKSTRST